MDEINTGNYTSWNRCTRCGKPLWVDKYDFTDPPELCSCAAYPSTFPPVAETNVAIPAAEYAALLARLETAEKERDALNRILRNESGEPLADYAVELMNEYDSNITNWSTQRNRAEAAEKALEETREMLKKYFDTWGQSNQALEEARKAIAPFAKGHVDGTGFENVTFDDTRRAAEWMDKWEKK